MDKKLPVLVIAFNRPELLRGLLTRLAPSGRSIYVSLDGPRLGEEGDFVSVAACRAILREGFKNLREVRLLEFNIGCRRHVIDAISWFFEKVDSGIILEDDLVPSEEFFEYCDETVPELRFKEDYFAVSGNCHITRHLRGMRKSFLTRHLHIWGWATSAAKWNEICPLLTPEFLESALKVVSSKGVNGSLHQTLYWYKIFHDTLKGRIDTWDYFLQAVVFAKDLKLVAPPKNLVNNVGFGSNSTHTKAAPFEYEVQSDNQIRPFIYETSVFPHIEDLDFKFNILSSCRGKLGRFVNFMKLFCRYPLVGTRVIWLNL